MKGFVICSVLLALASIVACYQPKECSSPNDCEPDECCKIGMQRYAVPVCTPLGDLGDNCRVGARPEDRTLFYPSMPYRFVQDSYALFCPCRQPLNCVRNTCSTEAAPPETNEYDY